MAKITTKIKVSRNVTSSIYLFYQTDEVDDLESDKILAAEAGGLKSPDEININNPEIELKANKNLECGSINT